MAKHKIIEPCIFLQDGKAVHHTEPGDVVELSDKVARELGDKVQRVDPSRTVLDGIKRTVRDLDPKPEGDDDK